jgi:hypothetical protein
MVEQAAKVARELIREDQDVGFRSHERPRRRMPAASTTRSFRWAR